MINKPVVKLWSINRLAYFVIITTLRKLILFDGIATNTSSVDHIYYSITHDSARSRFEKSYFSHEFEKKKKKF